MSSARRAIGASFDLAGPDRVAETHASYESHESHWWQVSTSITYPESGSAAPFTNSIARTRLTGLGDAYSAEGASGILTAESVAIEARGNATTSRTVIDRDNKTVYQFTDTPDSSVAALTVTVNGLVQQTVGTTGHATTYAYDALGRQVAVQDARGAVHSRGYDALGRDTGFSLGPDYAVQYAYDAYGRFHSVTSSVRSMSPRSGKSAKSVAIYSYLPNSDLVAGMTASSGFLWIRAYESGRSLITSVENRFGETVISRYDYENDALGRRTSRADSGSAFAAQPTYGDSATVEMPAYNAYSYNTRSEVTGAARRWGTPGASGDLVLGQQYAYEFDPIGNRITAAEGDSARNASYTANALNQYTKRTVPDEQDLIGTAPTNVAVTVNQNPVSRQSAYWHHALDVTNAASAAYPDVTITAVYNPPETNDPDVVTSQTGRVFVAETP